MDHSSRYYDIWTLDWRRSEEGNGVKKAAILVSALALSMSLLVTGCGAKKESNKTTSVKKETAGWCWFQDPRAVYYNGKTYYGYVDNGTPPSLTRASLWVGCYDHATKTLAKPVCIQSAWEHDDHDAPALHILPDGRIMAFYAQSPIKPSPKMRCRISTNPEDISSWGAYTEITDSTWTCYPKVVKTTDGRIYVFYRDTAGPREPTCYVQSDDNGATWNIAGTTVVDEHTTWPGQFTKVAAQGNKIYIAGTCVFHGSWRTYKHIYWAMWDGNKWTNHAGDTLTQPLSSLNMEQAFNSDTQGEGEHTSLIWDMVVDSSGYPHIAFAHNLVDSSGNDTGNHKYYEVRWTGTAWSATKICDSNHGSIHAGQPVDSGGVCLDQNDPDYAYCSVAVNGVLEIQKFHYSAGAWTKIADLTSGSAKDNMRPVSPVDSHSPVQCIWMYGDYKTFADYDTVLKMH